MEHSGYILIADITGYTVYLNESELDHARETLSSLLELLIENTRPPLVLSRLEGDAVFSYGMKDGFVDSQTFLEIIESTYLAFRRAIELMVLNNTCQCNACANVSSLDLKFFVHYGTFALQSIGESQELIGRDVNLVHRLLKNTVTEITGIQAYTLYTDTAAESLRVAELVEEVVPHVENVSDFDEVEVWIVDMHPIYEKRQPEQTVRFQPSDVIVDHELRIALHRELVWDYVTQTDYRNLFQGSDRFEVDRDGKRIGEGSVYQCYHGDRPVPQIVLEWRPFERMLIRQANPVPGQDSHIHVDIELQAEGEGTLLRCRLARPTGSYWQRWLAHVLFRALSRAIRRNLDQFKHEIEKDAADRRLPSGAALSQESIEAAADIGLRSGET